MKYSDLRIGGHYNFKYQPERLVYIGRSPDRGQIQWHQFEKVDRPGVVWSEVHDIDLYMLEETKPVGEVAQGTFGEIWMVAYLECVLENREVHEFAGKGCYYCKPGILCPHHLETFVGQ
jgi:hypothetical protein